MFEVRLSGGKRSVREWRVKTPEASIKEIASDPEHRRMAWFAQMLSDPENPGSAAGPIRLYVSGWDGSGLRVVGEVALGPTEKTEWDWPRLPQFLPGGERLNFVFRGSLWMTPRCKGKHQN